MRLCQCVDPTIRLIGEDTVFAGMTLDSREIVAGDLFAALKGTRADGLEHVGEAARRGAVAVLGDARLADDPVTLPKLVADNPRLAVAKIAAMIAPNQPATICAVTGTNGKSSSVDFLRQLWRMEGKRAASLGTLGLQGVALRIDKSLTTPDPVTLHRWLDEMTFTGTSHLALEASSHGLDQFRLDGIRLSAAAFTNLSRDHLDYHADFEAYFEAKLRLFTELLSDDGTAVLNADDPRGAAIRDRLAGRARIVSFGRNADDLRLISQTTRAHGQVVDVEWNGQSFTIPSSLIGSFQAMNMLTAAALAISTGSDAHQTLHNLSRLEGAAGRMQLAGRRDDGAAVFIDYAHTPDALERAILDLRPHVEGRLIVAFGCGGDRDTGKRPEMGAIAAKHADIAILTDDNPRSEDPASIRAQIRPSCADAIEIGDRAEAIAHGIAIMRQGDVFLIAGKGHEQGQIVGDRTIPFDDLGVARDALRSTGAAA
jgi:UDP-N-acetylmuramoyl-L-alanyl-D-glutamate--2,6-diaminopimelate ligase